MAHEPPDTVRRLPAALRKASAARDTAFADAGPGSTPERVAKYAGPPEGAV
jgi:hypothetical protein